MSYFPCSSPVDGRMGPWSYGQDRFWIGFVIPFDVRILRETLKLTTFKIFVSRYNRLPCHPILASLVIPIMLLLSFADRSTLKLFPPPHPPSPSNSLKQRSFVKPPILERGKNEQKRRWTGWMR